MLGMILTTCVEHSVEGRSSREWREAVEHGRREEEDP